MSLEKIFGTSKPIIGMIHLSGDSSEKIERAKKELKIYEKAGVNGVILEDYHGSIEDVENLCKEIDNDEYNLVFGVNVLRDMSKSFELANKYDFVKFIQIDAISGRYEEGSLDVMLYENLRSESNAFIMGGVWPKYHTTMPFSNLKWDLIDGKERCDAIVVTGQATGQETRINKIKYFREVIGSFPLIIGAGVNPKNVSEQLSIADGCIVGSCFKQDNDTHNKVDSDFVEFFMQKANFFLNIFYGFRKNC